MEGFEASDFGHSSQAVAVKTSEASEAVKNLIFLSHHSASVARSSCQKTVSHSGSSNNGAKSVRIIKSSFADVFKGSKTYRCPFCTEIDDNPSNIYTHIKSKHKEFIIQNIDESQRTFNSNSQASSHVTSNSSTNGSSKVVSIKKTSEQDLERGWKRYQCSACSYTNDNTGNVYRHMRKKHGSYQIQKVSDCMPQRSSDVNHPRTIFTSGTEVRVLKASEDDIRRGVKMYRCSACGLSSDATGNLYRHMRRQHKDYSIKLIQETNYSLRLNKVKKTVPITKAGVVNIVKSSHEEIARGEKPYKCSKCGKSSEHTDDLYAHMAIIHPECTIQYFKPPVQNPLLSNQIDTDNVVRVIRVRQDGKLFYKCSKCCLVSVLKSSVYKHMRRKHKDCTIIKQIVSNKRRVILMETNFNSSGGDNVVDDDDDLMDDMRVVGTFSNCQNSITGREDKMVDNGMDNDGVDGDFVSYECSVCMETFRNCNDLDAHVKIHGGDNSNSMSDQDEYDEDSDFEMEDVEDEDGTLDDGENGYISEEIASEKECNDDFGLGSDVGIEIVIGKKCRDNDERGSNDIAEEIASDNGCIDDDHDGDDDESGMNFVHEKNASDNECNNDDRNENDVDEKIASEKKGSDADRTVGNDAYEKIPSEKECSVIIGEGSSDIHNAGVTPPFNDISQSLGGVSTLSISDAIKTKKNGNPFVSDQCRDSTGLSTRSKSQSATVESTEESGVGRYQMGKIVTIIKTTQEERERGEKKYKCSLCHKANNSTSNVYKHMRHCHKGCIIQKINEASKQKGDNSRPECSFNDRVVKVIVTPANQSQAGKMYSCSECGHAENSTSDLYNHMHDKHKGFIIQQFTESELNFINDLENGGSNNTHISTRPQRQCTVMKSTQSRAGAELVQGHSKGDKIVTIVKTTKEERDMGGKKYKCSLCPRANKSTSNLYKHMRRVHKGYIIQKIKDDLTSSHRSNCGGRVVKVLVLPENQRPEGKMFSCSACGHADNSTSNLYTHMHSSHKGFIIQRFTGRDSDLINDSEPDRSSMSKRIARVLKVPHSQSEKGQKPYKCSECSFSGEVVGMVFHHIKICHEGTAIGKMKDLTNDSSGQSDSHGEKSVWVAKSSVSEIKKGFKKYRCSLCEFTRAMFGAVHKHLKTSHSDYVIERAREIQRYYDRCEGGNGNNNSSEKVVYVVNIPIEKGCYYKCSKCERTGNATGSLYKHMRRAHKDCVIQRLREPNKYYDRCANNSTLDKTVVRAISLPCKKGTLYKCSKCDYTNNRTTNLYKHMKRWHSEFAILKMLRQNDKNRERFLGSCDDEIESDDEVEDSTVHLESIESFECSVCMETFNSCNELDEHTKIQHSSC